MRSRQETPRGLFNFDKEFTSSSGTNNASATEGNGFASFLLGYPSGDSARQSTMPLTTPLDVYVHYFGAYLQDDWRVSAKVSLNYGVRIEHEDGIREMNDAITVGFDPSATNALSAITIPGNVDPTGGTAERTVTGGLMYAGVNGNPDYQGAPPAVKWSPRIGLVYAIDAKTVWRGGYGLYWAPWTYPFTNNYGQVGFTNNTVSPQTTIQPTVTLECAERRPHARPNGAPFLQVHLGPAANRATSRDRSLLRSATSLCRLLCRGTPR
jgi:hypothetical protein